MEAKRYKRDIPLFAAVLISYACYVITTLMQAGPLLHLLEPITGFLTVIVICACLSRMGRFWVPSFLLALGIFFYAVADTMIFISDYVIYTDRYDSLIAFVMLFPNYFYGASVALYFIQKLKGRQLFQFLINTFVLTTIGFVIFRKALIYLGAYSLLDNTALLRIYLYFFINLFILIMIGHMAVMIATEGRLKGTNTMILGIIGYILLDIPYTYVQVLGEEPENIYTNVFYMLCMILMAHGIYHQVHHQYVFKLRAYEYSEKSLKRTAIIVIAGIALVLVLFFMKLIDRSELFYLLIPMLVYWITTSSFQNAALNEQIMKQQDILTGLYNRRYVGTLLAETLKKAREQGKRFAVFCVDLNNFKPINDTYGHDMGDRVLKEFGSRMLALPSQYTSFRTGGDEFMIVRDDVSGADELSEAATKLQTLFNTPISLDTYVFTLSGSIGIAVYPNDATEPELLMRYADAAMYAVKHSQNKDDYRFFDISLVESVERHKALEEKLKKSDPARDFVLHYQPRVDASTGEIVAAEVFPRMIGEPGYTAADILPIAEEVGFMNRLGSWIIDAAFKQLMVWKRDYGRDLSLSINLSPLQLVDNDFLTHLKNATSGYGIDPSKIHLDISNDAIMGASISAKETLRNLRDYGFMLSLNDFGGYDINLSHILTCGFSAIHISPSLIRRADKEENANVLIRSIIGLAHSMNISAYAVGIENKQQADKLMEMGVESLQGYYYGHPVEESEFTETYIKKEAAD